LLDLQQLGFFGDMALKRTTNSYQVWRDILNPGKMMNGEAQMTLMERGWLTGLFGSIGLRTTNPVKYR